MRGDDRGHAGVVDRKCVALPSGSTDLAYCAAKARWRGVCKVEAAGLDGAVSPYLTRRLSGFRLKGAWVSGVGAQVFRAIL